MTLFRFSVKSDDGFALIHLHSLSWFLLRSRVNELSFAVAKSWLRFKVQALGREQIFSLTLTGFYRDGACDLASSKQFSSPLS